MDDWTDLSVKMCKIAQGNDKKIQRLSANESIHTR